MFDPIDYVRLVNAALTLATVMYAVKLRDDFAERPLHDRFFALAGFGCSLILGFGAIEAIVSDIPGGARVLLATPCHAWMLASLVMIHGKELENDRD